MFCQEIGCLQIAKFGYGNNAKACACYKHASGGMINFNLKIKDKILKNIKIKEEEEKNNEFVKEKIIFCIGEKCGGKSTDLKYGFSIYEAVYCEKCVHGGCVKVT